MPGYRSTCNYCDKDILSRDLGRHIFNHHQSEIFALKDNRTSLKFHTTSIFPLHYGKDRLFFCFGCLSCYSKRVLAQKHFQDHKCLEKHTTVVNSLLETYKSDSSPIQEQSSSCDDLTKKRLEDLVLSLYNRLHEYHACLAVHKDQIQFTEKDQHYFDISPEQLEEKLVFEPAYVTKLEKFIDFDEDRLRERKKQPVTMIYQNVRDYKDFLESSTEQRTEPVKTEEQPVEILQPVEPVKIEEQPVEIPPPPVTQKLPRLIHSQPVYTAPKIQQSSIPIIKNTKQEKPKPQLQLNSHLEKELSMLTPQQRQIFLQVMTQKDIDTLMKPI